MNSSGHEALSMAIALKYSAAESTHVPASLTGAVSHVPDCSCGSRFLYCMCEVTVYHKLAASNDSYRSIHDATIKDIACNTVIDTCYFDVSNTIHTPATATVPTQKRGSPLRHWLQCTFLPNANDIESPSLAGNLSILGEALMS